MDDSPELTIGEVARRAGIATSSIRYYESIGLLPSPERLHGQRRYDADVLGKLGFIGVARSAGFKLEEIKRLMADGDDAEDMGDRIRALSTSKLAEVEALLARAAAMKQWLEVANTCGCGSPDECTLFAPADSAAPTLPIVVVEGGSCRREAARG